MENKGDKDPITNFKIHKDITETQRRWKLIKIKIWFKKKTLWVKFHQIRRNYQQNVRNCRSFNNKLMKFPWKISNVIKRFDKLFAAFRLRYLLSWYSKPQKNGNGFTGTMCFWSFSGVFSSIYSGENQQSWIFLHGQLWRFFTENILTNRW